MEIVGRTFVVTGAGSGLGAATARMLVGAGGMVLLADVNEAAGKAVMAELGPNCRFAKTDVTDEASVRKALELAASALGPVSGVVQCAGVLGAARVVGREAPHDLALFARVVNVNLIGTFNVLRLAAATMTTAAPNAEGERGVIINTASIAAFDGQIGQAAYAASKGGVASLTLPAARELAKFGIRVVAIAPGVFETPMIAALPLEAQQALAAQSPFPHRLGRPSEYALLVRQIFENPMLNAAVVRLDGAMRMAAK